MPQVRDRPARRGRADPPGGGAGPNMGRVGRRRGRRERLEVLGADLDASGIVRVGQVGSARCRLMPQRAAVDFAVDWLGIHREVQVSG